MDDRLGDAELIDAVAQRFLGLVDGQLLDARRLGGGEREGELVAFAVHTPTRQVTLDHLTAQIDILVRRHAGDLEVAVVDAGRARAGDAAALELGLDGVDRIVGFGADGVFGDDPQHQVHTALEVEAQIHFLRRRIGGPGRQACDAQNDESACQKVAFHVTVPRWRRLLARGHRWRVVRRAL